MTVECNEADLVFTLRSLSCVAVADDRDKREGEE